MKTAVYYDTLTTMGGGERVAIELANKLNADIITAGINKKITEWIPIKKRVVNLGNFTLPFFTPIGTLFEAPLRFYNARKSFSYDRNIFIGYSSIYASNPDKDNYWFCLTPNRMLYDLKDTKQTYKNPLARSVFGLYATLFTKWDQTIVQNNFHKIAAQNKVIQERIKKYYGKKSSIIHSPINTKKYYFEKYGDFFLCVSRLFYEKRVDLIARSFTKMSNRKLIIVGNGPEKNKIQEIISKFPNITLITNCSEQDLTDLYARCLCTIYMPLHEDFGLSPLEGMASGKACIAADEGGLKETIINGKTGYRILAEEQTIIKAVHSFSLKNAMSMKEHCFQLAKNYDITSIINKWKILLR